MGRRWTEDETNWRFVVIALVGIFALNALLRVFYLRYQFVNGDEAVRALTALGVLRGQRLYVDIITDKPPGTTLLYAAILSLFDHSMPAVHVAAILWNFATAAAVFALGARFYSRRTGLWAGLLFAYFSSSYHTQDTMAANTELFMCLPYTLSVYCYLRGCSDTGRTVELEAASPESERRGPEASGGASSWAWIVTAGLFAGIAALFKQVGLLVILFFVLNEALKARAGHRVQKSVGDRGSQGRAELTGILVRVCLIALGTGLVAAALVAWLWRNGAVFGFWRNAVQLGALYVGSLPAKLWIKFLFFRSTGYILLTSALWFLAALGLKRRLSPARLSTATSSEGRQYIDTRRGSWNALDGSIALWGAVSLAGVFSSGRFYGHYFTPALPALSLLAARGIVLLVNEMQTRRRATRAKIAVTFILLLFSFIRFHHRTAILAYETISGRRTAWSQAWGMTGREREAEQIADIIRARGVGEGQPLYIWGYALDVYWRTGCVPASRYLTPYYVTGAFYPEVQAGSRSGGESFWQAARSQFIDDLKQSRPRLILNVDEPIAELPYPEVVEFVKQNYRLDSLIGPDPSHQFIVYERK
jgi:hypothetical protein